MREDNKRLSGARSMGVKLLQRRRKGVGGRISSRGREFFLFKKVTTLKESHPSLAADPCFRYTCSFIFRRVVCFKYVSFIVGRGREAAATTTAPEPQPPQAQQPRQIWEHMVKSEVEKI